jgi:hypothetical protein
MPRRGQTQSWREPVLTSRSTRLCGSALLLVAASVVSGCGETTPPAAAVSAAAEASDRASLPAFSERDISESVAFRERYGLRADLMWVRIVAANPEAQAGIPEFGVPLVPDELADLLSRRWDPDLLAQARGYGLLFPEDFAGAYINQKANGVVIAFKDRVERHRVALSNLVPPESVVEVRRVDWSLADLHGFVDQINSEKAWFDSIGVIVHPGENVLENVVDVRFKGPEEASGLIEQHFGNPGWLRARWTGPVPWTGPRADLSLSVLDTTGKPVPRLWCEYTPVDPKVDASGEAIFGTDSAGNCRLENLPVGLYVIELHRWVDNDHYDPDPIKTIRIELALEGTSATVVIPVS